MKPETIAGKYQIIRMLGRGGMGAVYEARHLGTGRRVAVKVIVAEALAKGGDAIARFEREARASGGIETQHVVQVFDTGVDEATGNPFMAMEFLVGEDLHQLIKRSGPLAPDVVLRLMAQASLGLQRAHEAGIVHRDIKSANMFLAQRDGDDVVLKLLDFGIAKVRADTLSVESNGLTQSGTILGSPLYMSPEQVKGAKDIDGRSDIWSLGIVMYEALTGTAPHSHIGTLGALILAICSAPPDPVKQRAPWVEPAIAAIVHKALALNPAARFQTAAELREAITARLPLGSSLQRGMLGPMPPTIGASKAPHRDAMGSKADVTASATFLAATATSAGLPEAPLTTTTTSGLGANQAGHAGGGNPDKSSSRRGALLGGLMTVLLAAGGYGLYRTRANEPRKPADGPTTTSSAAASTSASVAPLPRIVPITRTGSLEVLPVDAKVDVDGVSAVVRDGKVDVSGITGSAHRVHVTSGTRETTDDVLLTESGPLPARVELASAPSPGLPPVRPHGPPAPTVVQKDTVHPQPQPAPTPAPTPTKAGPTPAIDRTF